MTYTFNQTELDHQTIKFKVEKDGTELTFDDVIGLLISSDEFKDVLTNVLCSVEYEGFFWEVKSVTKDKLSQVFEFVVVKGNSLFNLVADKSRFIEYFATKSSVVSFFNLGKDAKLIVPTDENRETNYAHLASFLRTGKLDQIRTFWSQVGLNYQELISEETLWLSTAGLGVSWLHVRFDKRPKYYRHEQYK